VPFPNPSHPIGFWPEVFTESTNKSNRAWLHRSKNDEIRFVIDSVAVGHCQLDFGSNPPLALKTSQNNPVQTIDVWPKGSTQNALYVISKKLIFPQDGYCECWFHVVGNPDCDTLRTTTCGTKPPNPAPNELPCWAPDSLRGKKWIFQVGPGMDLSD
jgi:hypothetical protein